MVYTVQQGFLLITDDEATETTDKFQDTKGKWVSIRVASLTPSSFAAVAADVRQNPTKYRPPLCRRPGVNVGDKCLPLDWHEWDRLRNLAWPTSPAVSS